MLPILLLGGAAALLFAGCTSRRGSSPSSQEPHQPPRSNPSTGNLDSFDLCREIPGEALISFDCPGSDAYFDYTFRDLNQRVILGQISLEQAIQPNTRFTRAQMCNRLWRSAPAVAEGLCSQPDSFRLNVNFIVSPRLRPLLQEAFDTAIRLRPDLDPRQVRAWKIVPSDRTFHIILPSRRSHYRDWDSPLSNASTGSNIGPNGNLVPMTILDPELFEHGRSYAASVLAHELYHFQMQMTGNSHRSGGRPLEEVNAYDVGLQVLRRLRQEIGAPRIGPVDQAELDHIDRMIARDTAEQATWRRALGMEAR